MQYLTLGSDIKPTDLQDFYIAISASVAEDHLNIHNTTNELINSVTFKTSIKDPIKMACKTLLLPEVLYPSLLRGSACEFLGGITASTITECYNKKSILVNYSNLAIKAIPDSIAKPFASSFKKSAIDHKLDYVSAEAIYRVIGNDEKMLLFSIINADNFRKILNPQGIEINEEVTEKVMAPLQNITPLVYFGQNTTMQIIEESFS